MLREGFLQDKSGPSAAFEASALIPTIPDERRLGAEGALIVSGRLAPLTMHMNLGAGVDRSARTLGLWGLIAELPLRGRLRLVSEVNGENPRRGRQGSSVLGGLIWERGRLALDAAYRRGLSASAPDWALTTGLTVAWALSGDNARR